MLLSKKIKQLEEAKINQLNNQLDNFHLSNDLDTNVKLFQSLFENVSTFIVRHIQNNHSPELKCAIMYVEGLTSSEVINDNIIRPILLSTINVKKETIQDTIETKILQVNGIQKENSVRNIIEAVTYGETILFVEGFAEVFRLNTQKFLLRGITEPENERILMGPREGFNEALLFNVSMLHRRLRTNDLKIEYQTIGKRSNTKIAICYMNSIVKPSILKELKKRLSKIDIDGILDSNYIIELIKDNKYSPFRTIGNTERPDVVVGKMLEGRIAVLVDGTPMALTLPYLFIENFQSSEDYYLGFFYTSFSRMVRMFGFLLTCTIPSLYIAIVAFHHEMIPTSLFLNIAMERQSVPLPASVEAFLMLLLFEILRETGVRMPTGVGQALSIVGALVIGQAAVQAKLVAAPMIIIVGITGITSLLVPKMNAASIVLKFVNLIFASTMGLFGFLISSSFWLIHLLNLKSFGENHFNLFEHGWLEKEKDTFIRAPWTKLTKRPGNIANKNNLIRNRIKQGG